MTDLDAKIRERLEWDFCDPRSLRDNLLDDCSDAIRAVLDFAKDIEDAPQYYTAGMELQEIIAEELGVTDGER